MGVSLDAFFKTADLLKVTDFIGKNSFNKNFVSVGNAPIFACFSNYCYNGAMEQFLKCLFLNKNKFARKKHSFTSHTKFLYIKNMVKY